MLKFKKRTKTVTYFRACGVRMAVDPAREKCLSDYRKKLMEHKEVK